MEGIYAENRAEALEIVKKMLFEGCTITAGGSRSVIECGVWDEINRNCYNFLDRIRAGITPEEQTQVFRSVIGSDFYFCSTNAITEKGELLNVDGLANRVAAIAFGPKKVIMVVGVNKIVKDLNEGFLRVKREAAPKNCVRLNIDTPCAKLGHCISLEKCDNPDFTDGCNNPRRICVEYLITAKQREKGRISVILVNENLGF